MNCRVYTYRVTEVWTVAEAAPKKLSQVIGAQWADMTLTGRNERFVRSRAIASRDAKLLGREEALGDSRGDVKRICPCNVCISGVRNVLLRRTVRKHLHLYGRHLYNRVSTEVSCRCSLCEDLIFFRCIRPSPGHSAHAIMN